MTRQQEWASIQVVVQRTGIHTLFSKEIGRVKILHRELIDPVGSRTHNITCRCGMWHTWAGTWHCGCCMSLTPLLISVVLGVVVCVSSAHRTRTHVLYSDSFRRCYILCAGRPEPVLLRTSLSHS